MGTFRWPPAGTTTWPLTYPVRHGADTAWLTEPEVAERYRRRLTAQQDERARVETVVGDGSTALGHAAGIWLYAAAVPEAPVAVRLDGQTVQAIEEWHRGYSLPSPLGRSLQAYGRGIPAPGRVTFTGSLRSADEDETEIRDAYVALHVDGAAFAASPIGQGTTGEPVGRQLGEITLVDDGILLVDLVTRWCAYQAGGWGTATVVLGLVDADTEDGSLGEPVELVRSDTGQIRRMRGTRRLSGRPRTATMADLAAVDTVQRRLAVAYQALAGLLQWFGMAEPAQLRPDGTIQPAQFLMSRYSQVEQWAGIFGVDAEVLGR
jgi:hypothetical protein